MSLEWWRYMTGRSLASCRGCFTVRVSLLRIPTACGKSARLLKHWSSQTLVARHWFFKKPIPFLRWVDCLISISSWICLCYLTTLLEICKWLLKSTLSLLFKILKIQVINLDEPLSWCSVLNSKRNSIWVAVYIMHICIRMYPEGWTKRKKRTYFKCLMKKDN